MYTGGSFAISRESTHGIGSWTVPCEEMKGAHEGLYDMGLSEAETIDVASTAFNEGLEEFITESMYVTGERVRQRLSEC